MKKRLHYFLGLCLSSFSLWYALSLEHFVRRGVVLGLCIIFVYVSCYGLIYPDKANRMFSGKRDE